MTEFISQVRRRLGRPHEHGVFGVLRDEAGYVAEVANGRLRLRDCNVVGAWVRVVGKPRVENQGRIEIGERTRLICGFAPVELRTAPGAELRIGGQGSINFGTAILATKQVSIGERAAIGPYCVIADTELHDTSARAAAEARPIEIADDVWLASRVTVLPGAKIGRGSVITAGSVVAGEIPANVVAGGSPARVLRRLNAAHDANGAAAAQANGTNGAHLSTNGAADGAVVEARKSEAPVAPRKERASIAPPAPRPSIAHRGLLVSDFTIDELSRCFEADVSVPGMSAVVAPYDQVVPTLMGPKSAEHDYAVVWTRPEGVLASFARLLDFEVVDDAAITADVDQFVALLERGLEGYRFAFVPTWTVPPWKRGLGVADARASGVTRALAVANHRLIEKLGDSPNVFVLNAQRWIDEVGKGAHSAKLWYMGKVPFHPAVFEHATLDIKAAIAGITGHARKLVVVDLDDTLWGGIVGDVGWEKLRLGGHDSIGEAFVEFQRALKSLKRRGILLAMVSKNTESVALEAIRSHSAMVLKESDFVGWRINWDDKARNVADLVASLNLGLQSTVFVDDNPFERARVREALPEVLVPEWPEDKLAYASALLSLRCFDNPIRSTEDAARTEMYASERQREELRAQVGSLDEWLRSLELKVRVDPLGPANLARTTQLLNKTNQLNLTTRRLTEPELTAWAAQPGHWLYAISVSDRLGDAGLTGILGIQAEPGGVARVVDYVLSCRVMGRRVEETMVHLAVETARKNNLEQVVAELIPTAKNKPTLEFFERSGLRRDEGSTRFVWDLRIPYLCPDVINLSFAS